MDRALHYCAEKLKESGHNSKPVLLHSFKVSMNLYSYGYEENIVIAGALHDLIEDTDVTYEEIKNDFGKVIADIVKAVSFNKNIKDKYLQAKLMFDNCCKCGRNALLVKCSDLLDNINFVHLGDIESREVLIKKYLLFIEMSKTYIGKEKIYKRLVSKFKNIKKYIYE